MSFEYDVPIHFHGHTEYIPTLHDPNYRGCMLKLLGWQIRVIMRNDHHHTSLAAQGLLHLQLWHAGTETSILTPSNLTNRRFEIWNESLHVQVSNYGKACQIVMDNFGIHMPCDGLIHHYQCWLVWAPSIGVVERGTPANPFSA